jgi:enoyl-CoA hydratase
MTGIDPVRLRVEGAVLVISLNRPARRNAIDRAVSLALAAAADRLDADTALAVGVLTGEGGTFCSGMDLKAFGAGERVELPGRGLGGITSRPPVKPLIAAIEGYALAGGFELALACDLIVAAQGAVFGFPEVKRGLIAGSGGLLRLPERVPRAVAMDLALTGRQMPAPEAERWGLVNRLVSDGQALSAALDLAHAVAANAPLALAATKAVIASGGRWPEAEVWDRQTGVLEPVIGSDDAREGARAFVEKRPPVWTGR